MHFATLFSWSAEQLNHLYRGIHYLEHRIALEIRVNEFRVRYQNSDAIVPGVFAEPALNELEVFY
jgi:hypothetical protein